MARNEPAGDRAVEARSRARSTVSLSSGRAEGCEQPVPTSKGTELGSARLGVRARTAATARAPRSGEVSSARVRRIEKHLRRRGMIDASAEAHPSADPEDNLAASAVLGNRRRPQAPSGCAAICRSCRRRSAMVSSLMRPILGSNRSLRRTPAYSRWFPWSRRRRRCRDRGEAGRAPSMSRWPCCTSSTLA
jgi:hypothetical protein